MKSVALLLVLCSCTTVVINQPPPSEGGLEVDDSGPAGDSGSPPVDAAAETSPVDEADGGLDSGDASPPDASTLCTRDPWDDGICLGQTGNYNAWSCPTAKTDLPSCSDGGNWCNCVNMGTDAGAHLKCCNVSQ